MLSDSATQIVIETSVRQQRDADCYQNICVLTARRRSLSKHLCANNRTQIVIKTSVFRQRDADRYQNICAPTLGRRSLSKHMFANSVTQIVIKTPVVDSTIQIVIKTSVRLGFTNDTLPGKWPSKVRKGQIFLCCAGVEIDIIQR